MTIPMDFCHGPHWLSGLVKLGYQPKPKTMRRFLCR